MIVLSERERKIERLPSLVTTLQVCYSIFQHCILEKKVGCAIYFNQSLTFNISNCFFELCQTKTSVKSSSRNGVSGGAIFCDSLGGILNCCYFRKNNAPSFGSSVYCTTKENKPGQKLIIKSITDTKSIGKTNLMIEYGEQSISEVNISLLEKQNKSGDYILKWIR